MGEIAAKRLIEHSEIRPRPPLWGLTKLAKKKPHLVGLRQIQEPGGEPPAEAEERYYAMLDDPARAA